jgi:universal stress protein A
MNDYKKIIVAVDFNAQYENVIHRAMAVSQSAADLSLVYVSWPMVYIQPYLYNTEYNSLDDAEVLDNARKRLEEIAEKFGIDKNNVHVKSGDVSDEIKRIADESNADLIVLGTHGRSGIR